MPDERRLPPATALAARLLWNRDADGPRRRQPVVVLLGPTGAGKSFTLRSIGRSCDNDVVHTDYDFQRTTPADTMEVLTQLAYSLSRKWPQRGRPRFARLATGLIAVRTQLTDLHHKKAKEKLRAEFAQYTGRQRPALGALLRGVVDTAVHADMIDKNVGAVLSTALPELVNAAGRESLRRAVRWHGEHPDPRAEDPYDALLDLNRMPAAGRNVWLMAAFLADVRESQERLSRADLGSRCRCDRPSRPRHWHNWLLLLDNVDHPDGERFLRDLTTAREQVLAHDRNAHDPLLVMATSGRWNPGWEPDWRPPWLSAATVKARTVQSCRHADYDDWAAESTSPYYPVLLAALTLRETAHMLGVPEDSAAALLALRATGGLPAAVKSVRPLLEKATLTPGARDVLDPGDHPWQQRLTDLGLARHAPDLGIEEFVSAAPFATAPWLLPSAATRVNHRNVGRILTELRNALWVVERRDGSATADPAVLQPWIAGNLVLALTHRDPTSGLPSYEEQFSVLLNDFGTDRARRAYCRLALGRVVAVVDDFAKAFDNEPHRDWVDRLEMVCRAPDAQPLGRTVTQLFDTLVKQANRDRDRSHVVRNVVSRLVVANWLTTTLFTVPSPERDIVEHAYGQELPPQSHQGDVNALLNAARRAAEPLVERGVISPSAPWLLTPRTRFRRAVPYVAVGIVAAVVAALFSLHPWQTCGRGLTDAGGATGCVGLNLDATAFRDHDPLFDLEQKVAGLNPPRTGAYATVVLLEDMTPDPDADSLLVQVTRHDIEGAAAALWRADNSSAAFGTTPRIRLLLANFGSNGEQQEAAVAAIVKARAEEHIVAVVGLGQSLDSTRAAAASLSAADITVIGSQVTADDMNQDLAGHPIDNFFRVSPTNSEEVRAGVGYLRQRGYQHTLLVQDLNPADSYTRTLTKAFTAAMKPEFQSPYKAPPQLTGQTRADYMTNVFAQKYSNICADKPDVVYFAGRGSDLKYFLQALADGGTCGLGPMDIVTGDDASSLVGVKDLALSKDIHVYYTAIAHGGQWRAFPAGSEYVRNYDAFAKAFADNGFPAADLDDGQAMSEHDAVFTAAVATRRAKDVATVNTVAPFVMQLQCKNPVGGATGYIAFPNTGGSDPVDKAMPIMQIHADGSATQEGLVWPSGTPLDPDTTC